MVLGRAAPAFPSPTMPPKNAKKPPKNAKKNGGKGRGVGQRSLLSYFDAVVPDAAGAGAAASLTGQQKKVLNAVKAGESVFFTGAAGKQALAPLFPFLTAAPGTGKSHLLRLIIEQQRALHSDFADAVAVTASTGIAAACIGGTRSLSGGLPHS